MASRSRPASTRWLMLFIGEYSRQRDYTMVKLNSRNSRRDPNFSQYKASAWQLHRLGAALARDHRRAQEKLPGALGVGRAGAQFVEIALAHFRIARFKAFLVGDRLLLDEFDRHGAALQIVQIEEPLRRALAHDAHE